MTLTVVRAGLTDVVEVHGWLEGARQIGCRMNRCFYFLSTLEHHRERVLEYRHCGRHIPIVCCLAFVSR
jgi:hypothetical protein